MRVPAKVAVLVMVAGLGGSAVASAGEGAVPGPQSAVNGCKAGVLATAFRPHVQLCPRPLALTQIEHRHRRELRT